MGEEDRFVDNGDGTIMDNLTQLMWMKNDSYLDLLKFVTYPGAVKYLEKKTKKVLPDMRTGDFRISVRRTPFSTSKKKLRINMIWSSI